MSSRTTRDLLWTVVPSKRRAEAAPSLPPSPDAGVAPLVSFFAAGGEPAAEIESVAQAQPTPVREQAIFLLHIGAEIEHALMVEYLYAAFSLGGPQIPGEHREQVERWRQTITELAREEMGHLATVQNVLQLIGGPLTFARDDYPTESPFYPFPFELEPLTRRSLAKYVLAEAPEDKDLTPELRAELAELKHQNGLDGVDRVNRVGILYSKLIELFTQDPRHPSIDSSDILQDSVQFQARADEWGLGYDPKAVLILQAGDRQGALDALEAIAQQGEGVAGNLAGSHFERFLEIYRQFPAEGAWRPTRPLPVNPTLSAPLATTPSGPSRPSALISDPRAVLWAQLSNQRYRMLLLYLVHSFLTESPVASGERSARGLLLSLAFGEMYHLRSTADILAGLPLRQGGDPREAAAGPPFAMPYSLELPTRERDRWRTHRDGLLTTIALARQLRDLGEPVHRAYLDAMESSDRRALEIAVTAIGA